MKCPSRPDSAVFKLPEEDTWRHDNTCSYCGSLNPDFFIAQVEAGTEVIPTDKNYKAYLRYGPHGQAKFYLEHLSAEQRTRLIDLCNARKVVFARPGHFYVLPFFMRPEN